MKTHTLKLEVEFCDDVLNGEKTFELRFNDRQFQKGDRIRFKPVLSGPDPDYQVSYQCGFTRGEIKHPIMEEEFEITYVLTGWGLQDGYAALSIRKIKEAAERKDDGTTVD